MSKKLLAFLLNIMMLLSISVCAHADVPETQTGTHGRVTFTSSNRIDDSFLNNQLDSILSDLQPGDTTTYTIDVENKGGKTVDWYFANGILRTLEESVATAKNQGGAYSYVLTYVTSGGSTRELYNSDDVGGEGSENISGGNLEGLKEVNSALGVRDQTDRTSDHWIFLETMQSGNTGHMYLRVSLDGESQGNSYQNTNAQLLMRFAAEVIPTRTIVKTGDEGTQLKPIYIGMAAAGVLALGLAIDGVVQNKKKRGQKT